MTLPGEASGMPSDQPESGASTPSRDQYQKPDFDIDEFLGAQVQSADDDHLGGSGWRRKISGSGIRAWLADLAFGAAITVLKRRSGAVIMLLVVVLLVFGPNAPWGQLTRNILRGGADDASMAQCNAIGEWFSLFDQHTDRVYRLMEEAGSPDTWDGITVLKMTKLLPIYMDDWLLEMQKNQPPPAGRPLNDLYISFLENYGEYAIAIQEGDLKAQKHLERENSILLTGIDIETRHIVNLCI